MSAPHTVDHQSLLGVAPSKAPPPGAAVPAVHKGHEGT
jgi:hypothetical protein